MASDKLMDVGKYIKVFLDIKNGSKLGEKNFETFILLGFHPEYFFLNIFNFFDKDASNLYEIFFFK